MLCFTPRPERQADDVAVGQTGASTPVRDHLPDRGSSRLEQVMIMRHHSHRPRSTGAEDSSKQLWKEVTG